MVKLSEINQSLRQDNRGSSIVLVMITMLFVTLLGSIVLFMSYSSYNMKITEIEGTVVFYDATAALTEIETGIQQVLSSSAEIAYEDVLENYDANLQKNYTIEEAIHIGILEQLRFAKSPGIDGLDRDFILANKLNDDVLEAFVHVDPDTVVTISGGLLDIEYKSDSLFGTEIPERIVFKDVNVTVRNTIDNIESSVITDIVIDMPSMQLMTIPLVNESDLSNYLVVAEEDITLNSGSMSNGKIFGNNINVVESHTFNSIQAYARAGVKVATNKTLNVGIATTGVDSIWAKDLILETGSTINSYGDIFLADDLEIKGNTTAVFKGELTGFGNGNTPTTSSSILVDGNSNRLDLSEVTRLSMGGVSFIDLFNIGNLAEDLDEDTFVKMGDSLNLPTNQQAYLIPSGYIRDVGNNPQIVVIGSDEDKKIADSPLPELRNASLWVVDGVSKTLQDYGISVKRYRVPLNVGNQAAYYYFMEFDTTVHANEYFSDYFKENPGIMEEYIQNYLVDYDGPTNITETAGNFISGTVIEGIDYANVDIEQMFEASSVYITALQRYFRGYSSTSTTLEIPNITPYDYIVSKEEIGKLTLNLVNEFEGDAGVKAVVINNYGGAIYEVDSTNPYKLIVVSGNVDVTADYSGIVISGGNVSIQGNYTGITATDVQNLMNAKNTTITPGVEVQLAAYLDIFEENNGVLDPEETTWDFNQVVGFENWRTE